MFIGNIGRWISWWSRVTADKEAVVFGEKRVTYRQINNNINRIANALIDSLNIRKGDRVACLLGNCVEYLEIVFACAKIGARFVPLNVRLTSSELEFIINDCSPRVIFTEDLFDSVLDPIKGKLLVEHYIHVNGEYEHFLNSANDGEPNAQVTWEDDFAIAYTSGTTGLPKGAVLTHENIKTCALNVITTAGYSNNERLFSALPMCFTAALVPVMMPVMHSGGTMFIDKDFDPERYLMAIQNHKITVTMAVPTMYKIMSDHPIFKSIDFSSLKLALTGAAPIPIPLIMAYQERGVPFSNGYGLTEGSGHNMFLPPDQMINRKGYYLPDLWNDVLAVDDAGQPVKPGEVGELIIKGSGVMRGYWNRPEATQEAIKDGWLYTGDMATVDEEGYFSIVERKKDMIISGGLNVYPAEIENVIYSHSDISEVAVIGVPHEIWGEAVVALVVAKPEKEIDKEDLIRFCRTKLADYKSPKAVVKVDEIPRTVSGKVLKRDLREKYKAMFSIQCS